MMSWGYKITILYLGFVGFMLFMVVKCVQQDLFLVRDDYYEADLSFEDKFQSMENAAPMLSELTVEKDGNGNLILTYPSDFEGTAVTGKIHLYRPSNSDLDRFYEVDLSAGNQQLVPAQNLSSGLWEIRMECEAKGVDYYFEKECSL
jgi:nitrogen fixation protein FixH